MPKPAGTTAAGNPRGKRRRRRRHPGDQPGGADPARAPRPARGPQSRPDRGTRRPAALDRAADRASAGGGAHADGGLAERPRPPRHRDPGARRQLEDRHRRDRAPAPEGAVGGDAARRSTSPCCARTTSSSSTRSPAPIVCAPSPRSAKHSRLLDGERQGVPGAARRCRGAPSAEEPGADDRRRPHPLGRLR